MSAAVRKTDCACDGEQLYDALIRSTDDYIYICNLKEGMFRYPPAMVEEFCLPGEVVENALEIWKEKIHEDDWEKFLSANEEIRLGTSEEHSVEYRARNKNGEWVWLRCRGHVGRNEQGEANLFAGIVTNLGKRGKVDHTTGLFNTFALDDDLPGFFFCAEKKRIAVMIFDIDGMRRINSLHDRLFGDEVIRIVGQKIQESLPRGASLYRYDGDEFAVIFSDAEDSQAGAFYAEVREKFSHSQTYDGKRFFCTLSCGCANCPQDSESPQELLKYAGYALEYAKHRGKNQIAFYSSEILAYRQRAIELTELLRENMENGFEQFDLYYQPMYDRERKLCGAEALTHWNIPKIGEVGPSEFFPLLEESGLILRVGRWVFEQAVDVCARWMGRKPDFMMGINLSYLQMEEEGFTDFILDTLKKRGVGPGHIVLELTESCLAENMDKVCGLLQGLREAGLFISMDDFGTGYSSMSLLKQAPVDIVKLDKSFAKDISVSRFNNAFIQMMAALCRTEGIFICLEGVETEEEYEAIRPMKLDFLQGYLFGRPLLEADFEKLLPARDAL